MRQEVYSEAATMQWPSVSKRKTLSEGRTHRSEEVVEHAQSRAEFQRDVAIVRVLEFASKIPPPTAT